MSMKKRATKSIALALACVTLATPMLNTASAMEKSVGLNSVSNVITIINQLDARTLDAKPEEWNMFVEQLQQGLENEPQERGLGDVLKSALKFIIRNIDIIPSKTIRDIIKKYGGKIIDVLDTVNAYTYYGLAVAFKTIMPEKSACALADFLVTWVIPWC
ncbi:MAG: hypothetical protein ACRCX2_04700 [Paraclostridium sp.]